MKNILIAWSSKQGDAKFGAKEHNTRSSASCMNKPRIDHGHHKFTLGFPKLDILCRWFPK